MTDTAPELKPCPFCGGEPSKIHSRGLHEVVYCKECFSSTSGLHSDRAKAIAAWNTRAPDPDLDAAEARVKVLADALLQVFAVSKDHTGHNLPQVTRLAQRIAAIARAALEGEKT